MRGRYLNFGVLATAIVLFLAVIVLSNAVMKNWRVDLTEARLYTLADGTKNVIGGLRQPVKLRYFFSQSLSAERPQLRIYGDRVRELLEQYAGLSGGKIALEVIDPEPFSDAEDLAVQSGLQPGPRDGAGRAFYFGLAGSNSIDTRVVIPFFAPDKEDFLEYDLTKLIYSLDNPEKPVLGVVSRLPLEFGPGGMMAAMQGRSQPYTIYRQLREFFDVRSIDPDAVTIGADVDALLLVHPFNLKPAAFYAIDQYALRGGHIIAFVDPFTETAAAIPELAEAMAAPATPEGDAARLLLKNLLGAWGVEVSQDQFVADADLAQRVQTGREGPRATAEYIAWLAARAGSLNSDDVITAGLAEINLASAGAIKPIAGAGSTFTPLIVSSANSMLLPVEKLQGDPDPDALAAAFKSGDTQMALAARIAGPVKSAFPDGPPAGGQPAQPHLAASEIDPNIVLVGDVDLLDDRFWVETQSMAGQQMLVPFAGNGDFLLNVVDNLAGSSDLIGLRGRGRSARPFLVIESLRRQAEQQFLEQAEALQARLAETEKRMSELQAAAGKTPGGGGALLSQAEQAALEGFRESMVETRRELRAVQRDLNRDIETVEAWIKALNIGVMPLVVALIAIVSALLRRNRRARTLAPRDE